MKWTSRIIAVSFLFLLGALLTSNMILKNEYDREDKTDAYWTYGKVSTEYFRYLKIEGGNMTNIAFEQSPHCSVRVLKDWQENHDPLIQTSVKNDTLFVKFLYSYQNLGEKNWMKWMTLVRIFSPELQSIQGSNTNFEMFRLRQKSIAVEISGKSKFETESDWRDLDSLHIALHDSSEVVFEMSPEAITSPEENAGKLVLKAGDTKIRTMMGLLGQIRSSEAMGIQFVKADLEGYSLLDLGHAQIKTLQLKVADSSAIILSGGALNTLHK